MATNLELLTNIISNLEKLGGAYLPLKGGTMTGTISKNGATASWQTFASFANTSTSKTITRMILGVGQGSGTYNSLIIRSYGHNLTTYGDFTFLNHTTLGTVFRAPNVEVSTAMSGNGLRRAADTNYTGYKFRNVSLGTSDTPATDSTYGSNGAIYIQYE